MFGSKVLSSDRITLALMRCHAFKILVHLNFDARHAFLCLSKIKTQYGKFVFAERSHSEFQRTSGTQFAALGLFTG